jgi:hypothetical protein
MMQTPDTNEAPKPTLEEVQRKALQALNTFFGGRKARRKYYRTYLKRGGVPKMIFPLISQL